MSEASQAGGRTAVATEGAELGQERPSRRWPLAAAGIALFLAGGACGYGVSRSAPPWLEDKAVDSEAPDAWRDTIAASFTLTTSQTLLAFVRDRSTIDRDLAAAGKQVELDLPRDRIELPGQSVRRIDLLHASGGLIAQVAYFNPEAGPVALCVIGRAQIPEPVRSERRREMNVAYWSTSRHAFMLVGRAPEEMLVEFAGRLAPELDP